MPLADFSDGDDDDDDDTMMPKRSTLQQLSRLGTITILFYRMVVHGEPRPRTISGLGIARTSLEKVTEKALKGSAVSHGTKSVATSLSYLSKHLS